MNEQMQKLIEHKDLLTVPFNSTGDTWRLRNAVVDLIDQLTPSKGADDLTLADKIDLLWGEHERGIKRRVAEIAPIVEEVFGPTAEPEPVVAGGEPDKVNAEDWPTILSDDSLTALANLITAELMTNGNMQTAQRLVLELPGKRDGGGWGHAPLIQTIYKTMRDYFRYTSAFQLDPAEPPAQAVGATEGTCKQSLQVGELLPCPFCGGKACLDRDRNFWFIMCDSCPAYMSGGEAAIVKAWNNRSAERELTELTFDKQAKIGQALDRELIEKLRAENTRLKAELANGATITAHRKLRDDNGPSLVLGSPEQFVLVQGRYYPVEWIVGGQGLLESELEVSTGHLPESLTEYLDQHRPGWLERTRERILADPKLAEQVEREGAVSEGVLPELVYTVVREIALTAKDWSPPLSIERLSYLCQSVIQKYEIECASVADVANGVSSDE